MRLLNLNLKSADVESLKIEFSDGLNIISVSDRGLFDFFRKLPVLGICGTDPDGNNSASEIMPYTVIISAETPDGEICFINDRSGFSMENTGGENSESHERKGWPQNNFTAQDFILTSLYDPELVENKNDPVFYGENLKSLFKKNETMKHDSSLFSGGDDLLKGKEKELTEYNRERQLLELKKMKREKLLKEVQISEREINALEKKRESILKFKSLLNEIKAKGDEKNRLSAKINNLKKNLVELREINEKSDSMKKKLSERFPFFFNKGFEQLPDLNIIQETFNKYRDINEKIDVFFIKKKRFTSVIIKFIQAMVIFSFISILFILFKRPAFPFLGTLSALSAVFSVLLSVVYYFKIKDFRPLRLFEQKTQMENELIEILKKNHFGFENCRTGEIYELLFQYFNDFINYRDIYSELAELKKRIPDMSVFEEKEKKLQNLINSFKDAEEQIEKMTKSLDESIHIRPEPDNVTEAFYNVDELLDDNAKDIMQKKELIMKFEKEIAEYDKIENSSLSVENALTEIMKKIDICKNVIEHIIFLTTVLKDASESWVSQKMETLSCISAGNYIKLTGDDSPEDEITGKIKNFILNPVLSGNEKNGFPYCYSLSVKTALSGMLKAGDLPPFFLIDPFSGGIEFARDPEKLLLELFPQRQIIIILPETGVKFEGNLISI